MKLYIELIPAVGGNNPIKINFMEIDDIISAHGNEVEFKGNVNHYESREFSHAIIVIGSERIPVVQSSREIIKKMHDAIRNQLKD